MKRREETILAEGSAARRCGDGRAATIADVERLLDGGEKWSKDEWRKFRVKGQGGQRGVERNENGEALRYIEMVLRQLRRASRDHRKLVEGRNRGGFPSCDVECVPEKHSGVGGSLAIRGGTPSERKRVGDVSREAVERLGEVEGSREEPQELAEYPCVDVTRKLLAKRRPYARGIYLLETMPRRIHERMSVAAGRQGLRYVPAYQGIDTTIIR